MLDESFKVITCDFGPLNRQLAIVKDEKNNNLSVKNSDSSGRQRLYGLYLTR